MKTFRTILIDPPWPLAMVTGFSHPRNKRPKALPYSTMSLEQIGELPVPDLAEPNAHVWLWTTNRFLPDGFDLCKKWGFKVLCPVVWAKPSGCGAHWVHRTQILLHAYRGKLDMKSKLHPNIIFASARRHSQKPVQSYELIESISHEARLELFARDVRDGWTVAGDGVDGKDIFKSIEAL